jgi:hypothetical protein
MGLFNRVLDTLARFRYPVSLPQDVASAIGIEIQNSVRFRQLLSLLTNPSSSPTKLSKYMPREQAEYAFRSALRKESFPQSSLYSFYFNEGWLEFELQFDHLSRLRRVYLHHKLLYNTHGHELPL